MTSGMTTAERRGYQQICGKNGLMMVVACDQRGGMRKVLADTPEAQAAIDEAALGVVKAGIVQHLANKASCVLLDAVCAVPDVVDQGVLGRDTGLLIGLDASGWDTDAKGYRISKPVPGVTARRVRELGGTGAKLMVYLRPDRPEASTVNLDIIRDCIADFAAEDLLLVVEILTYQLKGESDADYAAAFPGLIVESARISVDLGSKVLKLPIRHAGGLCRDHRPLRRHSLGGAVGGGRSLDLHRPGGNRDAERGFRCDRGPCIVEGLHLARQRYAAGEAGKYRQRAAEGNPEGPGPICGKNLRTGSA